MKSYTVGFVFDKGLQNVLLVGKTHPSWQKGKFNGPGGRIEEGESRAECMAREIKEEASLSIPASEWREFAVLAGDGFEVFFFATEYSGAKSDAVAMTEEKVEWFPSGHLPDNVISNVRWLVPLGKDVLAGIDGEGKITGIKVVV